MEGGRKGEKRKSLLVASELLPFSFLTDDKTGLMTKAGTKGRNMFSLALIAVLKQVHYYSGVQERPSFMIECAH